MTDDWAVKGRKDDGTIVTKTAESRSDAEATKAQAEDLGLTDVEIIPPAETDGGGVDVDVVDHSPDATGDETTAVDAEPTNTDVPTADSNKPTGDALAELGDQLGTDPLDVLPKYMITHVDGDPSLNKRGVSVLAYHYGVSVIERNTVAYPHETDHQSAITEIVVENEDGRRFVGSGESHVDETPKHQLLRMAETRAYKRAVIFATGTGIVGYQELMEELQ